MFKSQPASFKHFLELFPEIELPIILTSESASEFSKFNEPFSASQILEYCSKWDEETDEFTEYVPCFSIPETGDFKALIYYKASLLTYGFYIVTYLTNGDLITIKPLNQVILGEGVLKNSAATIDEDWTIKIVSGAQKTDDLDYNTKETKMSSLEILPTGDVIYALDN